MGAGARVLATSVYYPLSPQIGLPRYGEVAALALAFLAITYILVALYARATREQARYATVTGKGFKPRQIALGRWRYVALGGVGVYLCFDVVLPTFVLLWSSLLDGYRPPTDWALLGNVSLKAFAKVFVDRRFLPALRNTLAVWLLSFIISFREFTIPLLLAGTDNMMLGPLLWRYLASSEMGQASALAVVMVAILLAVGGLARRLVWPRFGA